MSRLVVTPHKYPMFGPAEGAVFCLVTSSDLADRFDISDDGRYAGVQTLTCDPGDSFEKLLTEAIAPAAHILVITPGRLFESPLPEFVGPRRKLAVMACGSTPTALDAIEHFLGVIERTDPDAMAAAAEHFFELGEGAQYLELIDEEYGTRARFNHLNESYEWFEQLGHLNWGGQQLVPSGELSVLPLFHGHYDPEKRPDVTGELAIKGYPIVHSGRPSFMPADQARIYSRLALIEHHALIATIEHGLITGVRPSHDDVAPAADMLQRMFDVDSRFRSVWEIGFGINLNHVMYPGNLGMNEVHGGRYGAIHWGLGLTPWTQYHMDIVCPGTRVQTDGGDVLLGPPPGKRAEIVIAKTDRPAGGGGMRRTKVAACPCTT